ncbi:hypothetical protein E8K88_06810 [Lampropedia aestuarii]|uniref:Uncharacterized protein n=1 Tax=Lampropedia aestuarii TaxID=2562762 RepID=A0A4V3YXA1_9BURK|nr:hypothetical protein [Lampropedia aestuarii]THJ34232.1 hypothetical protein E8K88_06810 [Lampropedia aestuarii]
MLAIAQALAGLLAWRLLAVAPQMDLPAIPVRANRARASAIAAWLRKPSRRTMQDVQAQRLLANMQLMAALGGSGSEPS